MISLVPSSHPPKLQFFHYLIKPILRLKLREDSPMTLLFPTVTYTTLTLQDPHDCTAFTHVQLPVLLMVFLVQLNSLAMFLMVT